MILLTPYDYILMVSHLLSKLLRGQAVGAPKQLVIGPLGSYPDVNSTFLNKHRGVLQFTSPKMTFLIQIKNKKFLCPKANLGGIWLPFFSSKMLVEREYLLE